MAGLVWTDYFLCKIDALSDIQLDSQSMINQDTLYLHSALSTWHEAVAEAEPSQCRQKMSSKRDFLNFKSRVGGKFCQKSLTYHRIKPYQDCEDVFTHAICRNKKSSDDTDEEEGKQSTKAPP